MDIGLYTLTSALHDPQALNTASAAFIAEIERELAGRTDKDAPYRFVWKGSDFSDYGSGHLDVIYVRTGGTEGQFREAFHSFIRPDATRPRPVRLLTSGKNNSLAASMEILSFLRQNGCPGEILHGNNGYIADRLIRLARTDAARKRLENSKIGVIGHPSDWLIASQANYARVKEALGVELIDIPIEELIEEIGRRTYPRNEAVRAVQAAAAQLPAKVAPYWEGALNIYGALGRLRQRYGLQGLTLRCFDLLGAVHNTGCLALAMLNTEGVPCGCEGDVPTLLTLVAAQALTGVSGFQANPSRIDPQSGEMLFAHCTVPLNILRRYAFDTHFESGIGVAIHGELPPGEVTVFKLSGDLSRHCVFEATLLDNPYLPDLCRTQMLLRAEGRADYFLKNPIGNHHVILPGRHRQDIEDFLSSLD